MAGLDFGESTADEADVLVAEAEEVPGGLPCAVPVVGDDVIEVVFLGVIVDEDERTRGIREIGKKAVLLVGANEEDAVYEFLVEEFEVLTSLDELGACGFEKDFVAKFGSTVMNSADDFTKINVGKRMTELRDQDSDCFGAFPSEGACHLVGLVPVTTDGFENAVTRGLADAGVVVENEGNCGEGDAALAGDVFDGGTFLHGITKCWL